MNPRKKDQGGSRRGRDLPGLRPERDRLRALIAPTPIRPGQKPVVVTGTLRLSEVEAAVLVLDTDSGPTYELRFPVGWSVQADPGARVTVTGTVETGLMTTTQVGPVLSVQTLSRAG